MCLAFFLSFTSCTVINNHSSRIQSASTHLELLHTAKQLTGRHNAGSNQVVLAVLVPVKTFNLSCISTAGSGDCHAATLMARSKLPLHSRSCAISPAAHTGFSVFLITCHHQCVSSNHQHNLCLVHKRERPVAVLPQQLQVWIRLAYACIKHRSHQPTARTKQVLLVQMLASKLQSASVHPQHITSSTWKRNVPFSALFSSTLMMMVPWLWCFFTSAWICARQSGSTRHHLASIGLPERENRLPTVVDT